MSDKMTPEIRFKGFYDDWEQRRLGDNAIIKGRLGWKSLKQEEYTDKGPSMIAGRHIKSGIVDWNIVDHIPQWRYDESPEIMLSNGDIIFSKDGSLGNPVLIRDLKGQATINSTMMLVRTNETISSLFFYQILKSIQFDKLIYLKVSGSSIPHLFQADMNTFNFHSPLTKEQNKIGSFLKKLDNTIALHQENLNKLNKLKKGLLQFMFPEDDKARYPRLRFANFSDDWEQRKLGSYASFRRGSFPQPYGNKEWYDGENAMPFVQVVDITDKLTLVNNTKQKISEIAQTKSIFVPKGKVLVTLQGSIGRVAITQYNSYVDRTILIFEKYNKPTNRNFWAYSIQKKFAVEKQKAPGGTIKTITKEVLAKFEITLPQYEEQRKIGHYLKQLDNTIALHQAKLEKLQQIKKAYLQKMFI